MIKSNADNVGVFSTYTLLPSHFETDLELIQKELNQIQYNKMNDIYKNLKKESINDIKENKKCKSNT